MAGGMGSPDAYMMTHSGRAVEVMTSGISPRAVLTNEGVTFVTWAAFWEE
jgi:hypothetical protein